MNTSLTRPLLSTAESSPADRLRRLLYSPERMAARKAEPEMIALFAQIPDQSLIELSAFADKHGLLLTGDAQEVMLLPRKSRSGVTWEIACHPIGYCKIARKTGLFRPGIETLSYVDDGLMVTAHGYYRESISDPWTFTTSAFAHSHTYMEKTTVDEGATWEPTIEWRSTPEIRLAEIARVLCIQNAIPDQMAQVRVSGMTLESLRRMKTGIF